MSFVSSVVFTTVIVRDNRALESDDVRMVSTNISEGSDTYIFKVDGIL